MKQGSKNLNIKFSNTFCQYNLKVTEYVVCCLNIFLYEWMTLFVNNSIAVCFASFGLIKFFVADGPNGESGNMNQIPTD